MLGDHFTFVNANSMSRLSFQNDNIEMGSVLENRVLMTELYNYSVTSDEVAKHSAGNPITSRV